VKSLASLAGNKRTLARILGPLRATSATTDLCLSGQSPPLTLQPTQARHQDRADERSAHQDLAALLQQASEGRERGLPFFSCGGAMPQAGCLTVAVLSFT
jgi:hypothetical protein